MKRHICRLIYFFLTVLGLLALSSCDMPWADVLSGLSETNSTIPSAREHANTESKQKELAEEILRCFDERDNEGLKSLFSDTSKASPDLDGQIQKALDFYKGRLDSYDDSKTISTSDGVTWEDGIITRSTSGGRIRSILTDTNHEYAIVFYNHLVNLDEREKEGISELTILHGDIFDDHDQNEEIVVGEYYR